MPETRTQRRPAAKKAASTGKRPAAKAKQDGAVDRTTVLSDDVLKSLESGQRAAIDAVRKFVDTVDEKLPALGDRPKRRQEIVDSAMEMADRLVHTQYEFLRNVVQSAGKALSKPSDGK
jgi:hypothetical protein